MKEAKVLAKAAAEAHARSDAGPGRRLEDGVEPELREGAPGLIEHAIVGVGDAEDAATEAALRVEDASEKSAHPLTSRALRPFDDSLNALDLPACARSDADHALPRTARLGEDELVAGRDLDLGEVRPGPPERLEVGEGEPELPDIAMRTASARVSMDFQMCVPADETREVPASVVVTRGPRLREGAHAEQAIPGGEERPSVRALLRSSNVLPTALGEEPMIATGDDLSPVGEPNAMSALDGLPVREDLRADVTSIVTALLGAVDGVTDAHVAQQLRAPSAIKIGVSPERQ